MGRGGVDKLSLFMFHVKHFLTNLEKKGRFIMKKIVLSVSLSFLIILTTCICALADTVDFGIPTMDSPQYDNYIIYEGYYKGGSTRMYICTLYNTSDWDVSVNKSTGSLVWTKKRETAYVRYTSRIETNYYDKKNENNGWFTFQQDDFTTMAMHNTTIHRASEDIYDEDNLLFFQGLPLEKVVEKSLTEILVKKTVGTLKVLTLCGVGCLALLIALKLFGKKSLIFRP